MKSIYQELESILGCKIEMVETDMVNAKANANNTLVRTSKGTVVLVQRSLTALETALVEHWIEKESLGETHADAQVLLDPNGYKSDAALFHFPIELWRVLFKENHEDVREILASAFDSDRIINLTHQESVVFVTQSEMTPLDLLGMLESDALTRAKIIVGDRITQASELYDGYRQLIELTELAQRLKEKAQIITYDAFILPLLVSKMEGSLEHHIRPVGDFELEQTALIFFENNLNITETANQLFIHRNTLIYRLNKLESITGYDIRKFNDAIN